MAAWRTDSGAGAPSLRSHAEHGNEPEGGDAANGHCPRSAGPDPAGGRRTAVRRYVFLPPVEAFSDRAGRIPPWARPPRALLRPPSGGGMPSAHDGVMAYGLWRRSAVSTLPRRAWERARRGRRGERTLSPIGRAGPGRLATRSHASTGFVLLHHHPRHASDECTSRPPLEQRHTTDHPQPRRPPRRPPPHQSDR